MKNTSDCPKSIDMYIDISGVYILTMIFVEYQKNLNIVFTCLAFN